MKWFKKDFWDEDKHRYYYRFLDIPDLFTEWFLYKFNRKTFWQYVDIICIWKCYQRTALK